MSQQIDFNGAGLARARAPGQFPAPEQHGVYVSAAKEMQRQTAALAEVVAVFKPKRPRRAGAPTRRGAGPPLRTAIAC